MRCEPVIILVIKERLHIFVIFQPELDFKPLPLLITYTARKELLRSWNKRRWPEYTSFNLSSEQSHRPALKMPTIKLQSSDSEVFPVDVEVRFDPVCSFLGHFDSVWSFLGHVDPVWSWGYFELRGSQLKLGCEAVRHHQDNVGRSRNGRRCKLL